MKNKDLILNMFLLYHLFKISIKKYVENIKVFKKYQACLLIKFALIYVLMRALIIIKITPRTQKGKSFKKGIKLNKNALHIVINLAGLNKPTPNKKNQVKKVKFA